MSVVFLLSKIYLWLLFLSLDLIITCFAYLLHLILLPLTSLSTASGSYLLKSQKVKIIIIGYSFAGQSVHARLLKLLSKNGNVEFILINENDWFEFTPSIPNCFTNSHLFLNEITLSPLRFLQFHYFINV